MHVAQTRWQAVPQLHVELSPFLQRPGPDVHVEPPEELPEPELLPEPPPVEHACTSTVPDGHPGVGASVAGLQEVTWVEPLKLHGYCAALCARYASQYPLPSTQVCA